MAADNRRVVVLHALGESPANWDDLAGMLRGKGWEPIVPSLFDPALLKDGWTIEKAADYVATAIGSEPAHVVGHSLGSVVALQLAIRHPELVTSLFVNAPQAKPPKAIMRLQSVLMKVLPARLTCPPGITKADLLAILREVTEMNIEPSLPRISVPTTVLCGTKDRPNLGSARTVAQSIPGAQLKIIDGGTHQLPHEMAEIFRGHLMEHLPK